jgi:hypothetical protein
MMNAKERRALRIKNDIQRLVNAGLSASAISKQIGHSYKHVKLIIAQNRYRPPINNKPTEQ